MRPRLGMLLKCLLTGAWVPEITLHSQKEFDTKLGFDRQLSLKFALEMAGIEFSGREHDALDDARNTAEVLHIFKNETLYNQTLRKIEEVMTPKNLGNTMGSMVDFSSFVLA